MSQTVRAWATESAPWIARRFDASALSHFGVPHLVVDDVLPSSVLDAVDAYWPDEGFFTPEVPGNALFPLLRREYGRLPSEARRFWEEFNESVWPEVLARIAGKFEPAARAIFGDLFDTELGLDGNHPLTFMQADSSYRGHSTHTHFYHCPHWLFTVLFYVDREDATSPGTGIERLLSDRAGDDLSSSYREDDAAWRAEVAMDTFGWKKPDASDRRYETREYPYRANRLLAFVDGPLAFHCVADRLVPGAKHGRRRILRSHVKIHHAPFYARHAVRLGDAFVPDRYMRVLAPGAVLSEEDRRFKEDVLRPFFVERLQSYARAATAVSREPGRWERFCRRISGAQESQIGQIRRQFMERIP